MKIVFAGTPAFALPALSRLAEEGKEVAAVLTQPDRPQGRKQILTPSPVKVYASEHGIPVLQPERLKEDLSPLREVGAELLVTCAYGQLLTQETLDLFPMGVWNLHASLLPAYRGAAPIARAIMAGEKETGVTVMRTELGLDTGDILLARALPILETDTAGTLGEKLSRLAADLLMEALPRIEAGAPLQKQGEGFVCKKVQRTEVDFTRPAREVSALIRGLSPSPASYATVGGLTLNFYFAEEVPSAPEGEAGEVLFADPSRGLVVRCGEGAVRIRELQPSGGKRMGDRDFCNGRKIGQGARFEPVL